MLRSAIRRFAILGVTLAVAGLAYVQGYSDRDQDRPLGFVKAAMAAGKQAITDFAVIEKIGGQAAWLALWPRTGRTHQLRAHCAAIGTPILGDGKYGGAAAKIEIAGATRGLHLFAREITIPRPGKSDLRIVAPLSQAFRQTMAALGFYEHDGEKDHFEES